MREMDIRFDVTGNAGELFFRGDLLFGTLTLAQYSLSGFLVVPEIRPGDLLFESVQLLAIAWSVKDSS